uniref:Uncharacterized protein n=1 Tax=Anopheles darlingi TaxID=43151 RepID=A0A2M4D2Q1_ANODA
MLQDATVAGVCVPLCVFHNFFLVCLVACQPWFSSSSEALERAKANPFLLLLCFPVVPAVAHILPPLLFMFFTNGAPIPIEANC